MGAQDVAVTFLLVVCTGSLAYNVDLASLLKGRHTAAVAAAAAGKDGPVKRKHDGGNPCPRPEAPFPCRGSETCIPMGYVCDDSWDCEDGYDEDIEVCTALRRPPVQDIVHFLESEKSWILPLLFDNKPIGKVAHGLAVSQTVEDFMRRLNLPKDKEANLKQVLQAVERNDEGLMEDLGIPPYAWQEVYFIFKKLVKSGFH